MLILDTYSSVTDEPSGSPFCVKAMCLLHMSGLEWKPRFLNDPSRAPKKKLPVLHDGASAIADSEFIRQYLEDKHGIDFDVGLNDEQKAISRLAIRTFDEHFYFAILSNRWMEEANWQNVKKAFFSDLPVPLKVFVPGLVRRNIRKALDGHGFGRHSVDEQLLRAKQDVDAVAALLGDNNFLFGSDPSAADASVVPGLRSACRLDPLMPLSHYVMKNDRLMAYLDRAKEAIYPQLI